MATRFFLLLLVLLLPFGASAQSLERALMPGKVIAGHAKYEQECNKCHARFDEAAQPGLCQDCHKEVGQDVKTQQGLHGRMKEKECKKCHTDHKGRNARIVIFDTKKFDHAQADFQLKGVHLNKKVQCKDCHRAKEKYREAPSDCNVCHY